jgi:hypothetical protein
MCGRLGWTSLVIAGATLAAPDVHLRRSGVRIRLSTRPRAPHAGPAERGDYELWAFFSSRQRRYLSDHACPVFLNVRP